MRIGTLRSAMKVLLLASVLLQSPAQASNNLVFKIAGGEILFQEENIAISAVSMQSLIDRLSALEARPAVVSGTVIAFAGATAPEGYLTCDGSLVSKSSYPDLYAAIGDAHGPGNTDEFRLPDLRGEFIRGFDGSRGIDADRVFGSSQSDDYGSHSHPGTLATTSGGHSHSGSTDSQGGHKHGGNTNDGGGHSHGGSANSGGSHSHSGSANNGGAHSHSLQYLVGDAPGDTRTDRKVPWNSNGAEVSTNSGGAHSHSLSIDGVGGHTHTLSINNGGSHSHSLANMNSAGDHSHSVTTNSAGAHTHSLDDMNSAGSHTHDFNTDTHAGHTHPVTVSASGGAETRPRNVALLYCIKI